MVTGRRPALEAIRSGTAIEVLVSTRRTSGLVEVMDAAASAGLTVIRVPPTRIESLAPGANHQGVAVRMSPPKTLGEAELAARAWEPDAVVLVLDGVTDPHNVGAAARTAEAAGASALVVRRSRGAGITAAAVRSSAGALLHLPVASVPNIARALERLKVAGFWVVGLDTGASSSLGAWEAPAGRLALVLGSEGQGMARLVRATCDELVAIPLRGRVASLNVSVAAGIGLFAMVLGRKEDIGPGRPPDDPKEDS